MGPAPKRRAVTCYPAETIAHLAEAATIVRELATREAPDNESGECCLCGGYPDPEREHLDPGRWREGHEPSCPLRSAREWVDREGK